ncbi:TBC1 domain family member 2A [Genypterus blacodes]|uniref:TBC1 domain family member 2A n=1 Tax=Genypterus blacodes TaxID=154954 RepID=UPI003F759B03
MEGSGPGGNPSAASSRSLPVHAEEEAREGTDWISAPAASEEDHQQSREESRLSPSSSQTEESLSESEEDQQDPVVSTTGQQHLDDSSKVQLKPDGSSSLLKDSDKHQTHTDLPPPLTNYLPDLISDKLQEQNQKDQDQAGSDPQHQQNYQDLSSPEAVITFTSVENQNIQSLLLTEQQTKHVFFFIDKGLTQFPPHPADQLVQKKPPSVKQQTQQNPLPSNKKSPRTKDLKNQQDPPEDQTPSTDTNVDQETLQVPPFTDQKLHKVPSAPADQQNHLGSSQALSRLTEASTLAPPLTIEAFCDQVQPHPQVSSTSSSLVAPKLCGYLQKQGGPLKAWKQRWFTYEEKKNQLFYYRTPQDVTALGQVELTSATFTYPLKAESGTFHIQTPERTFILKAVSQEVMLYWLQQLQVNRWQHRRQQAADSSCCDSNEPTNNNNNNTADDFLPVLKSPLGLVGAGAASVQTQRTPLTNMSIKHPLIEIQNSVHSLRKRSSQEWSQSVFHVEAPPRTMPANIAATASPRTPVDPPTPTPSTPVPLPDPPGQVSPVDGRQSPSLFDSQRNTKSKSWNSPTLPSLRRDTLSSSFSDRTARLQQEKQMLVEEVKAQKELVWLLHKALEGAQLEKRTCAEFLAVKGEQERLELLRHRERQSADLRSRLKEAKAEAESQRRDLEQRDAQVAELQLHIRHLTEKNKAKQEVILKLSDHMSTCMSDTWRSVSSNTVDAQTLQLQQQVDNLKDDIEAYKTQNKFLNSEIYQLTKLWRNSSEREKSLMVKCSYLEATNCQVESRYLGVLRKLLEDKGLAPVQREAVRKLIEDALKGEIKNAINLQPVRDHDEYGFKIIPDYEVGDMKLLAKIQALEIRSHSLLNQEAGEHPQLTRWAHFLAGRLENDLCPSPELKGLLRGGVPQDYRQRVWRWVVRARTRTIRERHPERYKQLCEKSRTSPHPASRQIQLDLHRTLTTNQNFSSPSSPALQQLRRILLAFSWMNPAIGYCQGLNRLAAIALLVLQSEEDAFWCLVAVVETIMPQDYYTKNLVASQADQRVLKDFMAEKLPRLAAHFEEYGVDVSLITFNWFLVVFVEGLPSDILLRLWDAFLYEGTKVIFRYALALFKYKEDDILKIQDSVELYQYLRFFTKTISDGRKLTNIAFNDMNPFPGRLLRNRRAFHLERLQGELKELEEQQREFVMESPERKDKELDNNMSEDDEEL